MASGSEFLALAHGQIYPATEDTAPASAGTLLLCGDRIHGVYPNLAQAEAAAGAPVRVVDATGLTVLPGFVDCHVHLFFDGGSDMTTGLDRDLDRAAARAAIHLRAGVTTVRELGAPMPEVLQLRDRSPAGPRVRAAGPIITVPGGHGAFVGEEVPTGADLPAAVDRIADQGVDWVKIAVSGGVSTPGSDLFATQFTEPELRAGVEAAHRRGLPVAAHASNPASVRIAAAAGVDSVEHAVLVDEAALAALAHAGTVLVPTLAATNKDPAELADPALPAHIREKSAITLPAHRPSIRRAVAAGIPMASGTDGGSTRTGHGLAPMEAAQLVGCGLSPGQAIAALTRTAARLLGLGDRLGTLTTGAIADLVAVAGDPLADIGCLADVRLVVKGGAIVCS